MYPPNLDLLTPTYSERLVYDQLKQQLSNDCMVFYSVSWVDEVQGKRLNSEVDFLVFDPKYGYICIEVKGGTGVEIQDGVWYLITRGEKRRLNRSPYEQAEASMRYFLDYYEKVYNFKFKGVFGAMVFFPLFEFHGDEIIGNRPVQATVTSKDLMNLEDKIKKAFMFYKNSSFAFTKEQRQNILNIINKRLVVSAAAGALIEQKKSMLDQINRVQDNFIYMLENYKQFYIKGGAGTGKTWIAMKLAKKYLSMGLDVLLLCFSPTLANFIRIEINCKDISVFDLEDLIFKSFNASIFDINSAEKIIDNIDENNLKKYDAIIIDEGQDLNEEWSMLLRYMLKNQKDSYLNVFYDDTQNVYNRDFKDAFLISSPPYLLRENLRNTSSIYDYATEISKLGKDVITNPITGPIPESKEFGSWGSTFRYLEDLLNEFILDEKVKTDSLVIICDEQVYPHLFNVSIANWKITSNPKGFNEIRISKTADFKGLESDVVIYIHSELSTSEFDYVACTRARYFLFDFQLKFLIV
jgi:hypothetical protein